MTGTSRTPSLGVKRAMKIKLLILLLRKEWKLLLAAFVIAAVCFAYTNIVIRVICFLVSLFLVLMASAFFEHAVSFRNKWRTATSGKRRTPPGQSVIAGLVCLGLSIAFMLYCFHR